MAARPGVCTDPQGEGALVVGNVDCGKFLYFGGCGNNIETS
jgi:hypothetical protein